LSHQDRVARNQQFLSDLLGGCFRGHAIIAPPEPTSPEWQQDFTCSEHPLKEWAPWAVRNYELWCERSDALDDDAVPYVKVTTGTQVFAAAFGCPVRRVEGSNPLALPLVRTAKEADRLPEPHWDAAPLDRVLEFAALARQQAGPEAPLCVPDIQSPFDIAALIWHKEDLYMALCEEPEAVQRLVDKCHRLLETFLREYMRLFAPVNLIHYPGYWAPNHLGCSLSEDEAGNMNTAMFEAYCLPTLTALSGSFGGLFVHCCATANHQHRSFLKVPNLRAMQRNMAGVLTTDPRRVIDDFSGKSVVVVTGVEEAEDLEIVRMARPDTRFLFDLPPRPLDEARGLYERLRAQCPRNEGKS
jgi:hypothetical protein